MSRRRPQSSSSTSTADPPRDSLLSPTSPPLPTSGDLPGTSWVMRAIYAAALWQYVPAAKAQTTETGEESSYISEQYNICKDDIGACSGLIMGCLAAVGAALLVFWLWRRRRRRQKEAAVKDKHQQIEDAKEDAVAAFQHRLQQDHSNKLIGLLGGPGFEIAKEAGGRAQGNNIGRK